MSACQSVRPIDPFLFIAKVPFLLFLNTKGVYAYAVPLVTLILNVYGFVGLVPLFFLVKVPFLALF